VIDVCVKACLLGTFLHVFGLFSIHKTRVKVLYCRFITGRNFTKTSRVVTLFERTRVRTYMCSVQPLSPGCGPPQRVTLQGVHNY
jgi:hypothetical protein